VDKSTHTTLHIDPALRDLIIPHQPRELTRLTADLKAHGCRDALVVWEDNGALLDGHARYEICTRLGIPYRLHAIRLRSRAAARRWIIQNQLGRRNINHFQRDRLDARLRPKKKSPISGAGGVAVTTDYTKVHKIKRLQKSSDGGLVQRVTSGAMTIDDAYRKETTR